MHALDHAAVDLHHAFSRVLGPVERRDRLAGLRDLVARRRECRVAGLDLARVDECLAVANGT
jgi:hypothetical protein